MGSCAALATIRLGSDANKSLTKPAPGQGDCCEGDCLWPQKVVQIAEEESGHRKGAPEVAEFRGRLRRRWTPTAVADAWTRALERASNLSIQLRKRIYLMP